MPRLHLIFIGGGVEQTQMCMDRNCISCLLANAGAVSVREAVKQYGGSVKGLSQCVGKVVSPCLLGAGYARDISLSYCNFF